MSIISIIFKETLAEVPFVEECLGYAYVMLCLMICYVNMLNDSDLNISLSHSTMAHLVHHVCP